MNKLSKLAVISHQNKQIIWRKAHLCSRILSWVDCSRKAGMFKVQSSTSGVYMPPFDTVPIIVDSWELWIAMGLFPPAPKGSRYVPALLKGSRLLILYTWEVRGVDLVCVVVL